MIVKPRGEGSSLGVHKADNISELVKGIHAALELDDMVLVERFIQGMEINVGLLDGRPLGLIQIVPKKGLYDYDGAEVHPGDDRVLHAGAPFLDALPRRPELGGARSARPRSHRRLPCRPARGPAARTEYVLEANTLPGMTETSLLPKIAASAGVHSGSLCEAILEGAKLHSPVRRAPARADNRRQATGTRGGWRLTDRCPTQMALSLMTSGTFGVDGVRLAKVG